MSARERDGLFRRIVGLHEDFSVREKTPRAARNLRDKRKGALGSAEVRHVEPRIREHDADETQVRKVESLGDHLRAEHDVVISASERRKFFFEFAALCQSVRIDSDDLRIRKFRFRFRFDVFGAESGIADIERTADGARFGRFDRPSAVMTAKPPLAFVIGHRHGTVFTRHLVTAVAASEKVGKTSPI